MPFAIARHAPQTQGNAFQGHLNVLTEIAFGKYTFERDNETIPSVIHKPRASTHCSAKS